MKYKRFKLLVRSALAITALTSFFLAGFFSCFASNKYTDFSLKSIINGFFSCYTTWYYFPLFFTIGFGGFLLYEQKIWKESTLMDKMGRGFSHSQIRQPYGEAHFEAPYEYAEMAQIRPVEKCKGKVVGQLTDDGSKCIDFNPYDGRTNMHMLAIGTSGSGKTFAFVKPYLYQVLKERHSVVITDPDGGLFRDMAGYFRDNGYVVRKLDLKDLMKSDGWHCMATLRGINMSTNVKIFAQTVISNISSENNIYSSASNSLLCALLLRVLLGHEYTEGEKNIKSVYQLLQNPAGYSFLEQKFDKNLLQDEELPCLAPYLAYKQASENLAANIATHLANGLQLLQDEALCDVLSTDDIDLTLPGVTPCAYFCQFPDLHQTYRFIISLFFSMFFLALSDYADLHCVSNDSRLPIQVDFLLDEFYSIGIIPDWPAKMSVVRKRGINCVMIIQDIPQLQERYEKTWQTIVENCSAIVTLSINESDKTAPWLSKRIGETSIEVNSSSETELAGKARKPLVNRRSVGVGKRSLLAPDEICKICRDNNLILFVGHNPIYARKTPHTLFPDAKKLYKTTPDDVIDFSDREGRDRLRACEEAYRKIYWSTHDIHPDLKFSDLSDAEDLEKYEDPFMLFWRIIMEDCKRFLLSLRNLICQIHSDNGNEQTECRQGKCIDNAGILSTETAEKGSFLRFKEEFDLQYLDKDGENRFLSFSLSKAGMIKADIAGERMPSGVNMKINYSDPEKGNKKMQGGQKYSPIADVKKKTDPKYRASHPIEEKETPITNLTYSSPPPPKKGVKTNE